MDIDKIFQSKVFKGLIIGLGVLIILLLVFKAGMVVGIKKADFSCRWSDNYHRNFGGPQGGFLGGFDDRNFMDAHGVFGQIIKIDGQTLIIKGPDNVEKIVLLDGASIMRGKDNIQPTELKIDDPIVVIGSPNNDGQIEAKLIRIMPPMPPAPNGQPMPSPDNSPVLP
ncbi:MAG: hypothetical protein WC480_01685 [Patescibacteria group bacterium]